MFALLLALGLSDPTPLPTRIQDVTLYGSSALVRRIARLPGAGTFVVQGLPAAIDKDNVRVKCEGGDIIDVEVRERVQDKVPTERVQALRDKILGLRRELKALEDDHLVLEKLGAHLESLMSVNATSHANDVQGGKPSVESWNASFQFLSQKLADNVKSLRESQWKVDERTQVVKDTELELGRCQGAGSVRLFDVIVEVVTQGRPELDLEYFVGRTGWQPAYDLRTARDLSKVEMSYRARVWQQTGEDWNDVELMLSTAQPQRGAQGPEPQPVWLSVWQPPPQSPMPASERVAYKGRAVAKDLKDAAGYEEGKALDKAPEEAPAPRPFASVQSEGLSVRFKMAQKETIQSRDQPTTVLIGSGDLAITPERFCAPALDTTVWLRGKTKNTSPWVLLPGQAAVFFGADYLGQATLETVQANQEFTLHLGADAGLVVTRTQTEDLKKGPGFLSSTSSKVDGWRIHLENHGTIATSKDGSADVFVREVLPRTRDDRISVSVTKAEPKVSSDERWKQDMEEKGIQTWVVRVPKDGNADVLFQTTINYPKGAEIVKN